MNYLGLKLDGTWCFREHVNRLVPRLRVVSARLGRLMSNVGGPDGKARRLHAGILNSVALYGAPIWAEALAASRPMQAQLRRVQRVLAVRVARCYRTVSCVAATVLASMPPLELMALSYKRMYDRKRELIRTGGDGEPLARAIREMKHQTRRVLLERWQRLLANARYGRRTVEAVRPFLQEWVGRARGTLTFRMAQVLTGHGCFGLPRLECRARSHGPGLGPGPLAPEDSRGGPRERDEMGCILLLLRISHDAEGGGGRDAEKGRGPGEKKEAEREAPPVESGEEQE
ncbi:uncharacterized protein LOC112589824 [Harpegnathos saltator]|uniref:uncharacterized protein LOC112589824 n=1 Tax=Harpegnathos saltator TaxID=610380 RepID=UPI000DBEE0B6|nr:uncharacterized protein LOC112589824 [Harpegnathos saltator]